MSYLFLEQETIEKQLIFDTERDRQLGTAE